MKAIPEVSVKWARRRKRWSGHRWKQSNECVWPNLEAAISVNVINLQANVKSSTRFEQKLKTNDVLIFNRTTSSHNKGSLDFLYIFLVPPVPIVCRL
jgi:hypothetical protein